MGVNRTQTGAHSAPELHQKSQPSAFYPPPAALPRYGYRLAHPAAPVVSIITPYYNTGPLFLETVESLLRQSLQQWEWVIVNDGSDDLAALRVLLPLRSADARIRVIDQPHAGPSATRNAGVAASSAPLLFFLDSDDLIAPTALEKLVWTLVSHPHSAFATGWAITFGHQHFVWQRGFDTRTAFLYENMATSLAVIRRSVFEQLGGLDEQRTHGLEDYEFWLRCAAHGFWGHDIHEFLLWLRRKPPEAYTSYRWAFNDGPQHQRALIHELRARYPQLFRTGLPRIDQPGNTLLDPHAVIATELPFTNQLGRPADQRRVLLLLPWLRVGGSDRFALDLVAGLTARGDRVSVCLTRTVEHTWMAELARSTSDIFDLPTFLASADYPRFLHYLIESRQITTVLISQSLLAYQLLPYLRAHCPQVAFVDYLHMEEETWRHGGMPRAGIEHDQLLDLHIVSQHLRRWMAARGATAERIAVCPTNIDSEHWSPDPTTRARLRQELDIPADLPVLLYVGRLVSQKRPRFAVEVLRRLHAAGEQFMCVVAGDGEEAAWLQRFVRRHGMGDVVRLLGAVPHDRVRALLAASDLLVLPSAHEGIALVLYEALAMGVVPVAADVGGQRELVTPTCGVLVPPGPAEETRYVAALQQLLRDPTRRAALAQAGRERVAAHFTQHQMLDCMQALFDQATDLAIHNPQPPVSLGAGSAAATLAIEHHQLEERLRRLPPVRAILALRQTAAWRLIDRLRSVRDTIEASDRRIYAARRQLMQRARRLLSIFGG